jgi:hypothetical protein
MKKNHAFKWLKNRKIADLCKKKAEKKQTMHCGQKKNYLTLRLNI